ncbi:MAG: alpha/beta hydrolase, partial [Chloroflexota bacterium]|nr:alpha/beta hydrolase [Chloroflexota bacterium]
MQQVVPQFRFTSTRLATRFRMHYAEQGAPGGEVLICLHGYADSWYSYSRLLPLLPAHYHTYALSQRGHGDSERPINGYTVNDLAADVTAFMDAVSVPSATIVGDSSGAIIARRVAESHPERVARLVLIAAPIRIPVNEAT